MEEKLSALNSLKKAITPISNLTEADWNDFASIWKPFYAKRKEIISQAGASERYLYFILEGVQRVFYSDDKGREATIVFTYYPSFGGVIDSLILQQPSKYFYEALTNSKFIRAPFIELNQLMDTRPGIELLIRQGITGAFSGVMERLAEVQCFSSEEKFRKLFKRSPHLLQLIPQKYLANYLGMDETNFSKLMNKARI